MTLWKYALGITTALALTGCFGTTNQLPEDFAEGIEGDYINTIETAPVVETPAATSTDSSDPTTAAGSETTTTPAEAENLLAAQDKNAELSLQLEATQGKLELVQDQLIKTRQQLKQSQGSALPTEYLELITTGLTTSTQSEYPFDRCGRVANFTREGWYAGFEEALARAQITFASSFLEPTDLFGGCYSTQGNMVFFIGSEREDDDATDSHVLKYDIAEGVLTPALIAAELGGVAIAEPGKRNGAVIPLKDENGRLFRYYYDANIVVE